MKFEPFTITLCDDGETIEQAHVHPELTMITISVNGRKEPARVIDTQYFLMVADAIESAVTVNVEVRGCATSKLENENGA